MSVQAQVKCINCGTLNSVNDFVCTSCNSLIDPNAPIVNVGSATPNFKLEVLDSQTWTGTGTMLDVSSTPGMYYLGRSFTNPATSQRVVPDIDVRPHARVINGAIAISKRHLAVRVTDTGTMFARYKCDPLEPEYNDAVEVSFGELRNGQFVATIDACQPGQEFALEAGKVICLGNPRSADKPGLALLVHVV